MEETLREAGYECKGDSRGASQWPNAQVSPLPRCDDPIESSEITPVPKQTRDNKSPGEDGIPADVWKMVQNDLVLVKTLSRALYGLTGLAWNTGQMFDR